MYSTQPTNVQPGQSTHHYMPHISPPPQPHHHHPQRQPQQNAPRSPTSVVGIPSVYVENDRLVVGSSQSSSTRAFTILKVLGDGSFGSVWLCDWHGTLPPNTPLSPMQCGAEAKPQWAGKRLVAVKKMKKRWDGGWDECQRLKEIESLRSIPYHPNIIPLYDVFLTPATKELYFVFESMEGNLYQLIKTRKGRPLAGGLVCSIFYQIVRGLEHIHASGYFHRDMKPENVLVTTTGLFDYTSLSPIAPPNAPPEKDVVVIIKLADFGLARETRSKPPYTEYVSTRWYRAPEVLLSRDYSNPVDMWALGTIMAELVNLRPLFPGADQFDQVQKICEVLGEPRDGLGLDCCDAPMGGGPWPKGVKRAEEIGFVFPKMPARDIHTLFERTVPHSLIHCIRDLLRYNPDARLTSRECLEHRYLVENLPRNDIPIPAALRTQQSLHLPLPIRPSNGVTSLSSVSSRSLPPSHSFPNGNNSFYASSELSQPNSYYASSTPGSDVIREESRSVPAIRTQDWDARQNGGDYRMGSPPQGDAADDQNGQPMDIVQPSPIDTSAHPQKGNKLSALRRVFGGDKSSVHHANGLAPVQEVPPLPSGSHKRPQSSGSDHLHLHDPSPHRVDIKKNKKEIERMQREAEKQRRALLEERQREQARAVMQKRNKIIQRTTGKDDLEWRGGSEQLLDYSESVNSKGKAAATGPIRQNQGVVHGMSNVISSTTVNAASGRFASPETSAGPGERAAKKARMKDYDDGVSVASSDVHSTGRMSTISFATVDSDPGPSRIRNRPSLFGLNRMQSASSLQTSFDDFSPSARSSNSFSIEASARSSNSFSLEGQLANDFRNRASVEPETPLTGNISPPPMQMLSLSPSISPSPTWMHLQHDDQRRDSGQYINMPQPIQPGSKLYSHYDPPHRHPPSPGHLSKSDINPIFKVPPLEPPSQDRRISSPTSLPPFSELEAVAGGGYDYPPLSPMSFNHPDEDS